MSRKYDYDAIIIGAGISGLVCGCYLARAGMKTLIVEKNRKPGGYCTSFTRKGFSFDACAHSIGGMGEKGIIRRIIKELDIEQRLEFMKFEPFDTIISPDYKVSFWSDLDKTKNDLTELFPRERNNISSLFHFINEVNGTDHIQLRNKTLKELLDGYIGNDKLKSLLAMLAYGNLGLPPSLLTAFTAVKFYKQFIFDGGYYPGNQIQEFPDILTKRFLEYGGNAVFSQQVRKIVVKDNIASGIILDGDDRVTAQYVISNCDAMQTFFSLLDNGALNSDQSALVKNLIPSVSFFTLYLGMKEKFPPPSNAGTNLWYMSSYDLEKIYSDIELSGTGDIRWFMFRIMPNKRSVLCFTNAPFNTRGYWHAHKEHMRDLFIAYAERVIPGLSEHVVYKNAATPYTHYRWTLNYKGAAYGWASIPSQFALPGLSRKTPVRNLYLTGHWTTLAPGIPGVAYLGRDTAERILNRHLKRQ